MSKNPLTEKTRLKLVEYTAREINKRSKSLDQSKQLIARIGQLRKQGFSSKELEDISRIIEFKILIGFISLDLTTCVRSFLKAEFQYEGIYFLRQFGVVINEGYKKIYNFNPINQDGIEMSKNRSKSFWIKVIGQMVNHINDKKISAKYEELTLELDNFLKNNFQGIKELRDISVHYDADLIKVYDTFSRLNSDKLITNKFVPFYELLDSIFLFTHDLMMAYHPNHLK